MKFENKSTKAMLLITLGATAVLAMSTASAGITNTKHNLSQSSAAGTNNRITNVDEICVFCHTPHGANTYDQAPLWNRVLDSSQARFTTYSSSTLDAETADIGSISIACLSCHDGTQAIDSVINGVGSGNYNPLGAQMGGGDGSGNYLSTSGTMVTSGVDTGKLATNAITNVGEDLSNDHPISIQYGGGGIKSGTLGSTNDSGFVDYNQSQTTPIAVMRNNGDQWWIDTDGGTTREATDLTLFTRTDFTDTTPQPSVECGSCHDPHTEEALFMRVAGGNTGSALCLACHDK
jgi:predicted CXXCH cytochrome family protein